MTKLHVTLTIEATLFMEGTEQEILSEAKMLGDITDYAITPVGGCGEREEADPCSSHTARLDG